MSQWPNRYASFTPQTPVQQQQQQQQQQHQLLLQQQLAAAVSAPTQANQAAALNTYIQQQQQQQPPPSVQQGGASSIYSTATANLLAQFTNSNQLNQLTTAIAAMQQQQAQQQQAPVQVQQQQISALNPQNIGYQWSSGGRPGGIQQQIIQQPQQTSPRNVNLNQFNQPPPQQQQQQQQTPQDPRLANRKNIQTTPTAPTTQPPANQQPITSTPNAAQSNAASQSFEVRPLMDIEPKMRNNNNAPQQQQQQRPTNNNYNRPQNNNNNQNSRFNNNNNNKPSRFQPAANVNQQQQQQQHQNSFNRHQMPPTQQQHQQQRRPSPSISVSSTTSLNAFKAQSSNNNSMNSQHSLPRPKSKSPENTSTRRLSTSSHSTTTTTTITTNNKSSKYSIRLPKYSLDMKFNSVSGIKNRYSQIYIPSDFTNCKYSWVNSLPIDKPLKFSKSSKFHVMRKETQSIFINNAVYEPDDINHAWTVRVMLLEMPELNDLYKLNDDQSSRKEDHPNKQIKFLVGTKSKHELMAIGGAWSPSLDGPNPESNTQTLLNTAIRTTQALTGIDLSPCTQWFRMLEIQYNRNEEYKTIVTPTTQTTVDSNTSSNSSSNTSATAAAAAATTTKTSEATSGDDTTQESTISAGSSGLNSNFNVKLSLNNDNDIETTVIFMPNVWSLMPNSIEYQQYVDLYKNLIDNPDLAPTLMAPSSMRQKKSVNSVSSNNSLDSVTTTSRKSEENGHNKSNELKDEDDDGDSSKLNDSLVEASHYSKLDLKKMKVDDLREELSARNLETKGLKAQLIARLKEALDLEKEKEEKEEQNKIAEVKIEKAEEEVKPVVEGETVAVDEVKEEKKIEQVDQVKTSKLSKSERERYYKLPSSPQIIVHPSNSAKTGKFDCQAFSLSSLLDYRKDDNKETTFEVSLFAECFNEMLIRDFGFTIYKSLLTHECEKIALKNLNGLKRKNTSPSRDTNDSNEDAKRLKSNEEESSSVGGGKTKSAAATKTINQNLLLSFLYFDTNRTNYFLEKDLEDLLLSIGLSLNRSKLKSLINRLSVNKDSTINYRQLTDKSTRDSELLANNSVKIQIPSDAELIQNAVNLEKIDNASNNNKSCSNVAKNSNLIEFNGNLIDIENIMAKLEKSETLTQSLEAKLKDSNEQIADLKSKQRSNDRAKDKLYDEVQDLKKKLKEQQRLNKEIDDKYSRYKDCVYRSKSQLNKLLDDYNDTIKRTQPPAKPVAQQQQPQQVEVTPTKQQSADSVQQQQQPQQQQVNLDESIENGNLKIEEQNESTNGNDDLMVIDSINDSTPQENEQELIKE